MVRNIDQTMCVISVNKYTIIYLFIHFSRVKKIPISTKSGTNNLKWNDGMRLTMSEKL